jgi:hypothetical protein
MRPVGKHWAKRADEQWVVGDKYFVDIRHERSDATHKHEFAWLREAWLNLPEHLVDLYPNPEMLRKRALIEAGYYNEDVLDCGNNAAALRVATYLRGQDAFTLTIIRGPTVLIRRAKSQSYRAMSRQEFQSSKSAIMEVIASLIGTTPEALRRSSAA